MERKSTQMVCRVPWVLSEVLFCPFCPSLSAATEPPQGKFRVAALTFSFFWLRAEPKLWAESGGSSVLHSAHGAGARAGECPLWGVAVVRGGQDYRISQGFLLVRIRASSFSPESSTHGKHCHWCTYALSYFIGMVLAPLETAMTEPQPSGICV